LSIKALYVKEDDAMKEPDPTFASVAGKTLHTPDSLASEEIQRPGEQALNGEQHNAKPSPPTTYEELQSLYRHDHGDPEA
jgi:hypothetical protein